MNDFSIDITLLQQYIVNLSAAIPGRSLAADDEATIIRGRQERFACATLRQHKWEPVNDTASLLIVGVAELSNKRCFFYTVHEKGKFQDEKGRFSTSIDKKLCVFFGHHKLELSSPITTVTAPGVSPTSNEWSHTQIDTINRSCG